MLRRSIPALAVVACLLAGCASAPVISTRILPVAPSVPADLLACQAAPPVPVDAKKQSQVADYVVSLWEAGQDCRSHLGAVAKILSADQAQLNGGQK